MASFPGPIMRSRVQNLVREARGLLCPACFGGLGESR